MEYTDFIESKKHSIHNFGIDVNFISPSMFPYQEYVSTYLINKGRAACFLDTGLGKTLIELCVAKNYLHNTNKRVLILTPLAVAFQFLQESIKFEIDDIEYSRDGKFTKKIVIANYERLHYFNALDFECVILDEASILKNFDGVIKSNIISFLKKVKYRFLFTATPSPNDFIELGNSSEALGYMGYMDMLTRFFTNSEESTHPQNIGVEWILKGHAKESFFNWVSSWSISMRKPSDLGFDDSKHILPELITSMHSIKNDNNMVINGQIQLFNQVAKTNKEIHSERKQTIIARCEKSIELALAHPISVYWCNLNQEGNLLASMDKEAYQLTGSMSLDKKEEILLAFSNGEIKKLITKPKISCFGLNWQHCGHTTYFPTFSYEQFYQSLRRFWRFGRIDKVFADIVFSDGQKRVLDSLLAKADKANEMFDKLNAALHKEHIIDFKEFNQPIILPTFLK